MAFVPTERPGIGTAPKAASDRSRRPHGLSRAVAAAALVSVVSFGGETFATEVLHGRVTDLPVPRFVTMDASRGNVRAGPGIRYPIEWTYTRDGLPLEITHEFGNWRRIRDWTGSSGWMHHALLDGRRTAIVSPWDDQSVFAMRGEPSRESAIVARLEAKAVLDVISCNGVWCEVSVKSYDGFVLQSALWGVYPGERVDG